MTEAFIEGMSFSKEQKSRLKKMIDEKKLDFQIGAIIELKEEEKNKEVVTVNASLASSFNSTPLIASTSSSPQRTKSST